MRWTASRYFRSRRFLETPFKRSTAQWGSRSTMGRLIVDANLLFALDNNGVRDKVTPLVGFE